MNDANTKSVHCAKEPEWAVNALLLGTAEKDRLIQADMLLLRIRQSKMNFLLAKNSVLCRNEFILEVLGTLACKLLQKFIFLLVIFMYKCCLLFFQCPCNISITWSCASTSQVTIHI